MNTKTTYLGLELPHPFIAAASYLTKEVSRIRALEDAGAAAIVLPSLFEEQVRHEKLGILKQLEAHDHSQPEALSYLPKPDQMTFGGESYVELVRKAKEAVKVPVIASLNGATDGGWLGYAKLFEQAGADAIELNVYWVATDLAADSREAEKRVVEIVRQVKASVSIPIAVKLSPYYSSVAHLAADLDAVGADGLVLFNRFFQPDYDINELEVLPSLKLSTSEELPLRLSWLGILQGRVKAGLSVTGGVHTVEDSVKAVMAGADTIQLASSLIKNGVGHLTTLRDGLANWLSEHEYESLAQMKGSMSLQKCPDPSAYLRQNYMQILQTWAP
jgi:dihydroorotate dehydrogenase (fumarate)